MDFGSARYGSTFSIDEADRAVAGTRCEFTVAIGGNPTQHFGQFPGFNAIWISDIKINLGDIPGIGGSAAPGLVYSYDPIYAPSGWNWMMFNRTFRFATTWFNDQEPIGIRVRYKAHLMAFGAAPVVQDYDHTYYLTAHNKLQQIGNKTYFNPSPPPGSYEDNLVAEMDSNGITTAAHAALTRTYRPGSSGHSHDVHPGAIAQAETKATVMSHLRASTAFCAATHGNALALLDSASLLDPDDINFQDDVLPLVELKTASPKRPPFQLVVLYACGALGGAAAAFQVGDPDADPGSKGRIVLGFWQPVSYFAMSAERWQDHQSNPGLGPDLQSHHHAEVLFSKIAEGKFHATAVYESNLSVKTLKPKSATENRTPWQAEPMAFVGDIYARLYYVWLSESEYNYRISAGLPVDVWWHETGGSFQ